MIVDAVILVVLSYSVLIAYICRYFGMSEKCEYTNRIYYS